MIKNLNRNIVASIALSLFLVIILILGQSKKPSGGDLEIMKAVFRDASIVTEEGNTYRVKGDNKREYDLVSNSPITDKVVTPKFLKLDIDNNGTEEVIAVSSVKFIGQVCIACGGRLYIDVVSQEKNYYSVSVENEFSSIDGSNLFLSDINTREVRSVDINGDGSKELEIIYKADSIIGLDKEKVAVFQWIKGGFKVIWQQIIHINMDNYGRLQEEDKQNFDATFKFAKSDSDYPHILVEKTVSKDKGVSLTYPERSIITYKFNGQEYQLWKEEKINPNDLNL